jgi:hypothetical protein
MGMHCGVILQHLCVRPEPTVQQHTSSWHCNGVILDAQAVSVVLHCDSPSTCPSMPIKIG